MNPRLASLLVCACCASAPAWSQTAPVLASQQPAERGEPNVKRTVTEDEGSKIDELRVRGQVTQVVVTPKVGVTRPYEILLGRGGREPSDGTGGANSAVGKRVWNVLAF